MRFALQIEPQQGLTYADQRGDRQAGRGERVRGALPVGPLRELPGPGRRCRRPTPGRSSPGWPGIPTGSASATLVSPVTFRHPGNLAKVVTTVDEMSGGRLEVGLGAGLERRSSTAQLGLPFPPIKDRADLLEDQLAILHGLWGEPDGWSYDGQVVSIAMPTSSPSRSTCRVARGPRSVRARPRILVGGSGSPRSYAHRRALRGRVQHLVSVRSRQARQIYADVDAACEAIGRDPATRHPLGDDRRADRPRRGRVRRTRWPRMTRTLGDDADARLARRARAALDHRDAGSGARRSVAAVRERRRRADHAPGLPALGPRHDRPHGRGARRPGLTSPRAPGPSVGAGRPPRAGSGWPRRRRLAGLSRRRPRPPGRAGRRGGSGRGSCRGRGRSARSGAGAASPFRSSAATGDGRAGVVADEQPPGGRQRRVELAVEVGREDRRRPDPEDARPRRVPAARGPVVGPCRRDRRG